MVVVVVVVLVAVQVVLAAVEVDRRFRSSLRPATAGVVDPVVSPSRLLLFPFSFKVSFYFVSFPTYPRQLS